jgi:hypothetical protein
MSVKKLVIISISFVCWTLGVVANGAMMSDPYKGAQYSYNDLGMPIQTTVPAIMGTIKYKYLATGEKLEAQYNWHSVM